MVETTTQTCRKLEYVLVDAHVEAEMHQWWRRWNVSPEEHAKHLEKTVKEFVDFLRDHRSQDMIELTVIRNKKDLCSACRNEWETDTDENGTFCVHCGATVEAEAAGA